MMFAGAAPHAWFQSRFGLNFASHASSVMVEPTRIMLYQLRSSVAAISDRATSSRPAL